jgi:hypothetical protein
MKKQNAVLLSGFTLMLAAAAIPRPASAAVEGYYKMDSVPNSASEPMTPSPVTNLILWTVILH